MSGPTPWQPGDPLPRPEDVIPHRPPFLLVDEITEIVPDVRTRGRWTPSGEEPFFVANEKAVSSGSATRVTDGAASLAAMSRMAASDADQLGNR